MTNLLQRQMARVFAFLGGLDRASPQSNEGTALLSSAMSHLAEDTKTSREMQQRSISWMGTTVSALVFGILIYYSAHTTGSYWLVTAVLGLGAPIAAAAASAVFLGELARQGRAAIIRRSLELWAQGEPGLFVGATKPINPIFGERLYASMGSSPAMGGYEVKIYYLAILSLFGAGLGVGPLIATLITWGAEEGIPLVGHMIPHSLVAGVIVLVCWAAVTVVQARAVSRMARKEISLHAES